MIKRAEPKSKTWTVPELSDLIGGQANGHKDVEITGIAGIREAVEGDVTFVANPRYLPLLKQTKASAVVVSNDLDVDETESPAAFIRVDDPAAAFARIAVQFTGSELKFEPGVHAAAIIGKDVRLGERVTIQAYAVICDGAAVGDDTVIYPGVYVGHETQLGSGCLIYPGVKIRERVKIGNNVIIHCGAVIGSDGFGFATINGVHHKIPQVGTVEIEDDVEIGANVAIDRARFDKTLIGKGTKIDNLVQIAHNVRTGECCMIVGQSGIAGSARLGNNVVLAAQAGIDGHIEIGDNTIIAAKAGVTKPLPPDTVVSGFPAKEHDKQQREQVHLRKLPETRAMIKELEERLSQLEKAAKNTRS